MISVSFESEILSDSQDFEDFIGYEDPSQEITRFEKARMIVARALQLSLGAPFMLKLTQKDLEKLRYNPIEIAKLEFKKGVIPLTVKRPFPEIHQEVRETSSHVSEFKNTKEISAVEGA